MKPKYIWKKVYYRVAGKDLDFIANYDEKGYIILANKTIKEYNLKKVNREKVEQFIHKINK